MSLGKMVLHGNLFKILVKMYPLTRPEVVKLFSFSTQLNMKFDLLINLKLLTIANSLVLNIAEHENYSANKYEYASYCCHFHID